MGCLSRDRDKAREQLLTWLAPREVGLRMPLNLDSSAVRCPERLQVRSRRPKQQTRSRSANR